MAVSYTTSADATWKAAWARSALRPAAQVASGQAGSQEENVSTESGSVQPRRRTGRFDKYADQ